VLPVVVEKINRVLDGVVDVEVEWTGANLHGRVGEHLIGTRVTRLVGSSSSIPSEGEIHRDEFGREVVSRCFHVPINIVDTDECSLPKNHPMKHKCHHSSVCVNTNGSYECRCPRLPDSDEGSNNRSPWEVSFASAAKTSCPSSPSTDGCCPVSAHSSEGKQCRARFKCPVDPCSSSSSSSAGGTDQKPTHDCAPSATCVRAESPNNHVLGKPRDSSSVSSSSSSPPVLSSKLYYTCECPDGFMGNGRSCRPGIDAPPKPMLMFDGVTPTALTIKNNYYCGCTKPKIDACSGFPPCQGKHEVCTVGVDKHQPTCACRSGYVHHDEFGCVDENPPTLKLRNDPRGDQILRLKQGDEYREHMVDIVDENAEDYLRSLKVTYSQPLPPGCLTGVGEFHVNYTVAMPWANPPFVRVTRRVIIEDIDECAIAAKPKLLKQFKASCPQLVPQCDTGAGAECRNTRGSYECRCPAHTNGDGFLPSARFDPNEENKNTGYPPPASFQGGTSCVDTSKPVMEVRGPNPKIFRVAKCGGLSGVMSPYSGKLSENEDQKDRLVSTQQGMYEADIREMIKATAGAELCATHENPRVKSSDCIEAIDYLYTGEVDLSDRVKVGDPIRKSHLKWVVPYDVTDDAGNKAETVYREVVVEEIGLFGLEKKIREEVAREEQRKTKRAIDAAVSKERQKWEAEARSSNNSNSNSNRSSRRNSNDASRTCPSCPPCVCPETDAVNPATCSAHCNNMSETCRQLGDDNFVYKLLLLLEDIFPVQLVPMIVLSFVAVGFLYVVQWIWTLLFNPRAYANYDYGNYSSINDEMLLATAPRPSQQAPTQAQQPVVNGGGSIPASTPRPPTASLSLANYNNNNNNNNNSVNGTNDSSSFFSPGGSQMGSPPGRFDRSSGHHHRSPATPAPMRDSYEGGSVYQSPPLIVPSRNGEGGRRRTPYR